DLSPAEPAELLADDRVMAIQERPPGVVTEDTCPLGRPDDVGEQDRRQDSILLRRRSDAGEELLHFIVNCVRVADVWQVIPARQFDQLRSSDVAGEKGRVARIAV